MLGRSFVLALAALLALVLAFGVLACGSPSTPESPSTTSSGGAGSTSPAGSIPHPTGAADVVLRVSAGGGLPFPEIGANYTRQPEFTMYGDGRIIVLGPYTEQYPLGMLPNLQTTVVSEKVIQNILAAAREAKLFQKNVDYGSPESPTDQDTTTIVINAGGATYTSAIYALGLDRSDGLWVSAQQQLDRDGIEAFRVKLSDPGNFGAPQPTWEAYGFTVLAVFSAVVPPDTDTSPTDYRTNYLPWPLADLATSGSPTDARGLRKTVIAGDALAVLNAKLSKANQLTRWQSGGANYNIWLRPLLPDEATTSSEVTATSVTGTRDTPTSDTTSTTEVATTSTTEAAPTADTSDHTAELRAHYQSSESFNNSNWATLSAAPASHLGAAVDVKGLPATPSSDANLAAPGQ